MSDKKLGRPALYVKPLAKTFMMSEEANSIIDRKAREMGCSRSDVVDHVIRQSERKKPEDDL